MLWIRFDESDHMTPAPSFCLPTVAGGRASGQVCLQDFHEDCNLALFFTHGIDCAGCMQALQAFAGRRLDYWDLDTRILAVLPEPPEKLAGQPALAGLPFPLLSDPQNTTRQTYSGLVADGLIGENDSLLFVLDRYNAPYAALANHGEGEGVELFTRDDVQDDILKWFEYIGVQCPE
jgi:peroxiredoxin